MQHILLFGVYSRDYGVSILALPEETDASSATMVMLVTWYWQPFNCLQFKRNIEPDKWPIK